jgi:hypothetical protein
MRNTWTVMVRTPLGRVAQCKSSDRPIECVTEAEAQAIAKRYRDSQSPYAFGGGNHYWAEEVES